MLRQKPGKTDDERKGLIDKYNIYGMRDIDVKKVFNDTYRLCQVS